MTATDWLVIIIVLAGIILYGLYKSRTTKNLDGYFLSNNSMPWYLVLLSIMGTQASAITFLSGPGQAYADGMRFVQYYFGIPLAMVVICISFVPLFNALRVYTAYEFLEQRFDLKTRTFTSLLFLLQRGLSTGISIYAPSIILAALFGWDIFWVNIIMGGFLIIYTVAGGARAVAYTQTVQVVIIFIAMALTGYFIVHMLPAHVSISDALHVGGRLGKLNVITSGQKEGSFDWTDRYNIWSGIIGGFFLALSYFGTDHSQVGRYLTAKNNRESRIGLLMNGLVKVPMQFFILLLGVLVFVFYQFNRAPLSFNDRLVTEVSKGAYRDSLHALQQDYDGLSVRRQQAVFAFTRQKNYDSSALSDRLKLLNDSAEYYRSEFRRFSSQTLQEDPNDTNYVFLSFVKHHLPEGLKGLLIAIIFLAGWGSIAAALNALAASSVVDLHRRMAGKDKPVNEYRMSRWYTLGWGLFSILIAQFANQIGKSLIEAVNILGSLFYGVILGIFLVAFYLKRIKGPAVFWAALVMESYIILSAIWPWLQEHLKWLQQAPYWLNRFFSGASGIGFLWLNVIGAMGVVLLALLLQVVFYKRQD